MRIVDISKAEEAGWTKIQVDEHCTISVRANGTVMEMKSEGVINLNLKHMYIVAFLIKFYK